jgi:tubulin-specific chaperone D
VPYILVLWLSIIVLVPFDLTTIDSANQESQVVLVKRIINIGKSFMKNSGKLRDGSAVMLAKLITRPDVVKSGETNLLLSKLAEDY